MKRPLLLGCICLSLIIAVWTRCFDAPPFYSDFSVKEGEQILLVGQVYQKESRSFYGTEQTNLYLKSIRIIDSGTGQVQIIHRKNKIICEQKAGTPAPRLGEVVKVTGSWKEFSHATNPGEFDQADYYGIQNITGRVKAEGVTRLSGLIKPEGHVQASKGLAKLKKLGSGDGRYWYLREELYQLKEVLKGRLYQALPGKEAGILAKMLLGSGDGLDEEIRDLYQRNGIVHILSISGLHITMIGMSIYHLLRKCTCPVIPAAITGVIILLLYGTMTGFGVSACRAIGMYLIRMLGEVLGRDYDLLTAVGVLLTGILLGNPRMIYHSGFLLSFASVLGVGILGSVIQFDENSFRRFELPPLWVRFVLRYFGRSIQALWVSAAISIFTMPIVLYFFYEIPVYSPFVNLLILPFMGILMVTGIGIMILPGISVLAGGVHMILNGYEKICQWFEGLPYHTWVVGRPEFWKILVYYAGLALLIRMSRKKKYCLAGVGLLIVFLGIRFHSETMITFLDVGQGDCIVIMDAKSNTFLVDGGSSTKKEVAENVIQPFLKYHGIDSLDGVFITHPDKDHMNGIEELLEENLIEIRTLYLADTDEACKDEFASLMELVEEEKVTYYGAGDVLKTDRLQIHCLHPQKGVESADNISSGCFLVQSDGCRVLLTGDVEGEGERMLVEELQSIMQDKFQDTVQSPGNSFIHVLKAAHHGSRYATTDALLTVTNPSVVVISCSEKNPYGHPHEELLERLSNYTKDVYATKDKGAITVYTRKRIVKFYK